LVKSPSKDLFRFVERAKLACADDCSAIRFCQGGDFLKRVDRGFFRTGYDQPFPGVLILGKEDGASDSLSYANR
jgi:hypothetical protein